MRMCGWTFWPAFKEYQEPSQKNHEDTEIPLQHSLWKCSRQLNLQVRCCTTSRCPTRRRCPHTHRPHAARTPPPVPFHNQHFFPLHKIRFTCQHQEELEILENLGFACVFFFFSGLKPELIQESLRSHSVFLEHRCSVRFKGMSVLQTTQPSPCVFWHSYHLYIGCFISRTPCTQSTQRLLWQCH